MLLEDPNSKDEARSKETPMLGPIFMFVLIRIMVKIYFTVLVYVYVGVFDQVPLLISTPNRYVLALFVKFTPNRYMSASSFRSVLWSMFMSTSTVLQLFCVFNRHALLLFSISCKKKHTSWVMFIIWTTKKNINFLRSNKLLKKLKWKEKSLCTFYSIWNRWLLLSKTIASTTPLFLRLSSFACTYYFIYFPF